MGAGFLVIGEHKDLGVGPGLVSKDKINELGAFASLGGMHDIWIAPNSSNKLDLKLWMSQLLQY